MSTSVRGMNKAMIGGGGGGGNGETVVMHQNVVPPDYDDIATSSILEFLNQESQCNVDANDSELDIDSIFEEINRLSDATDERSIEELIKEAENLINNKQQSTTKAAGSRIDLISQGSLDKTKKIVSMANSPISCESTPWEMREGGAIEQCEKETPVVHELPITSTRPLIESEDAGQSFTVSPFATADVLTKSVDSLHLNSSHLMDARSKTLPRSRHNHRIKTKEDKENRTETPTRRPSRPFNETFVQDISLKCSPRYPTVEKSGASSPCQSMTSSQSFSWTKERALENDIVVLQEKLKDTQERLQSLKIQHDSLSQLHRVLRENYTQHQDESERLKLDLQHLTECANVLRNELHAARYDRDEALELQNVLQIELEESRCEKKKVAEQSEKDAKTIQDLQRQCREMERILMRKHPDSVSALIVASPRSPDDSPTSRRMLEQRIAQLESDAKQQDIKSQKILASVNARFSCVKTKYDTHIADLETQVLSLQDINTRLNEKIECQSAALKHQMYDKAKLSDHSTQTLDVPEREHTDKYSISTQTDVSSATTTVVKQSSSSKLLQNRSSGIINNNNKLNNRMSSSCSDGTLSHSRDDAHLLATIRGMRVDLAIKEKALLRLTRELDECKKTMKKLQRERDALKAEKSASASGKRQYDPSHYSEQHADVAALKEAHNRIKMLEFDFNALQDKRLQDLKTLQAAHERELNSCHETVRILQERLAERDEAFAMQKRRKVPVDYLQLKAKVSSLERRHTEREERLHMLVEALTKGRLNGALEEILNDNNGSDRGQCH